MARAVPIASDGALLAALFGSSALIARSQLLALRPELIGSAILVDLVLTSALCHWIVGVRWGGLPAWTTIPVAALGLALSRRILPSGVAHAGVLPLVVVVAVEGATLLLTVTRAASILGAFRAARALGTGTLDALELGFESLGPHMAPLARWFRLELGVWGYFLFGWYLRARGPRRGSDFSHHQNAGWSALAGAFALLVVVEGAVVHLWLAQSGRVAALWSAFALHVYGCVWIVGDALALAVNRTRVLSGQGGAEPILEMRVGIRARGRFPISSIVEVQVGSWDTAGPHERLVRVAGPANVRLIFERPMEFRPMFGAPVEAKGLLLQVDEPDRFQQALRAVLTVP